MLTTGDDGEAADAGKNGGKTMCSVELQLSCSTESPSKNMVVGRGGAGCVQVAGGLVGHVAGVDWMLKRNEKNLVIRCVLYLVIVTVGLVRSNGQNDLLLVPFVAVR